MGIFAAVAIGNNGKIVLGVQGLAPDKAQENAERYLCGDVSEKRKIKYVKPLAWPPPRKRSFSRSHRENAGRASAGLVRPVLENRSNRAAETAEFREQPKRRFQRQTPHAKPRRCWIEHSLACF